MKNKKNQDSLDVSAIIPTYNSEKYIKKTIDSILNQTIKFNEIIVIDDNSQDDTYLIINEIAREHKKHIKVSKLSKNFGTSYVRNLGLNLAHCDWVLFMDHDDIAEPDLLEEEIKRLKSLKHEIKDKYILVHSAYRQITEDDRCITGIHRSQQICGNDILGYQFVRNNIITTSGVLLNKTYVLEVGGFNEELKYSQDWDLWIKLAQKGSFAYVDKPLINVRRHISNTSNNVENFLKDEITILNQYDLSFIKRAVYARNLPQEKNMLDFVSILYRLGYWNEGYEVISKARKMRSDSATLSFLLGLYYLNKDLWKSAQECFQETIKMNPTHGAALNNLGAILSIKGEKDEGIKLFKKSNMLFPNYNDVRHNLKVIEETENFSKDIFRFTWRELRPVLLTYYE